MMRTEVWRPRCPVERWYWIAAEHPPLRVAVRAKAAGKKGISISGELSWNLSYIAVVVSQQSTERFADYCRRIPLQAIA